MAKRTRPAIGRRGALLAAVATLGIAGLSGCDRGSGSRLDAGLGDEASPDASRGPLAALDALAGPVRGAIAKAENLRRVRELPEAALTAHDAVTRREVARALARIGGDESAPGLLRALGDDDEETVAWGAYGLGFFCKGHEKERVAALAARVASLPPRVAEGGTGAATGELDARTALARAVGQCGGEDAEPLLVGWLRDPLYAEGAALGLGDAAVAGRALSDTAVTALLDVASASASSADGAAADVAFYPLARLPAAWSAATANGARLLVVARAALGRPGPWRLQAVRALRHAGAAAAPDLQAFLAAKTTPPAEASEAARTLGALGAPGQAALVDALSQLVQPLASGDPFAVLALSGDGFGPLSAAVHALTWPLPASAAPVLLQLTKLRPPGAPPTLERRLTELRCASASLLAGSRADAPEVTACTDGAPDDVGGTSLARARLDALLRRPLVAGRKTAFRLLARDPHLVVREAALEAIPLHPELGDAATRAIAEAMDVSTSSPLALPGLTAVAAKVLAEHPDRALGVSARERMAALDPSSPPPGLAPERQVDPALAARLDAALAFAWPAAAIETRTNLLDAASALHLPSVEAALDAACRDPNPVIREHAARGWRTVGKAATVCAPGDPPPLAAELAHPGSASPDTGRAVRLVFVTDAGELTVHLDPSLSPVAAAHYAALARSGIYKGTVVHRVVPGFVAQFGDPGGDGYGGGGPTLRCETSPVPFAALDVGVPLGGRDTGSSQLFVTLARTPHLDGGYARVGHAEGDWAALAQGDVIRDVRVEAE